jgi:hypothetical protein
MPAKAGVMGVIVQEQPGVQRPNVPYEQEQ